MRIDGKKIASELLAEVKETIANLPRTPRVCVVTVEPTPATESYLKIKTARAQEAGMVLEVLRFTNDATEEEIIEEMLALEADAIVVQLPLPQKFDTSKILNAIPIEKDADVLAEETYACFEKDVAGALLPPVVGAIAEIITRSGVELDGKKVVVVGSGKLVGRPASLWCAREGADVTVITRDTQNSEELLREAQIIITGAGVPGRITPEVITPGVVLIDAGTSESGGAIVGDIDPACEESASVFTPVPGGVGPIAVACLFKNVGELANN